MWIFTDPDEHRFRLEFHAGEAVAIEATPSPPAQAR
jgi:hypothetical protein